MIAKLPSSRRVHREFCGDQPHERRDEAVGDAPGTRGLLTGVWTGQPDLMMSGQFDRDLGARVPGADDEDSASSQLRRVAVSLGVKLDDGPVQLAYAATRTDGDGDPLTKSASIN